MECSVQRSGDNVAEISLPGELLQSGFDGYILPYPTPKIKELTLWAD